MYFCVNTEKSLPHLFEKHSLWFSASLSPQAVDGDTALGFFPVVSPCPSSPGCLVWLRAAASACWLLSPRAARARLSSLSFFSPCLPTVGESNCKQL